jgi:hypothetical protein
MLVAFGFQLAICTGFLVTFSIVRPWLEAVYQPRVKFAIDQSKKPPALSIRPLAWLWPAFYTNELEMINMIGMDSIMFLRFILVCFKFFSGSLVVAVPLLIFNYHSPGISAPAIKRNSEDDKLENVIKMSLGQLTMENLPSESQYFYLYSFSTFVISFYAYWLFYWTWRDYVTLRKKFIISQGYLESVHARTLLLNNISPKMHEKEEIKRIMLELYQGAEIDQIVYGRNFREIDVLCEKHRKVNDHMEQNLDNCISF